MGVLLKDVLSSNEFKGFKLLAGAGGLDNQIQGVAILDAPDGFQWTLGREWIITSGYVLTTNPDLMKKLIESGRLKDIKAFGIKLGRYIDELPDDVIAAFEEHNVPLISIPSEISWMGIMNSLNVLVMNQSIRQFNIGNINPNNYSNLSYQVRKIHKILSQFEKEMTFPAMLYDLSSEKAYYSSSEFSKLADQLQLEDFWTPKPDYQKEVLCSNLNMVRYRFTDDKYDKPFSWITVPIVVGDKVNAYFVVVEATGLIDYFDQFALRIGFVLLQSLFEQILMAQSIGDAGFEKFVLECLSGSLIDEETITKRASELDLNSSIDYYLILMTQTNPDIHLAQKEDILKNTFNTHIRNTGSRMALIDDNNCLFLVPVIDGSSEQQNLEIIRKNFKELYCKLKTNIENIQLLFGISDISDSIYEIKRNFSRCEKIIANGQLLFPDKNYLLYSDLGVFAWLDIQQDEIEMMLRDFKELFGQAENSELIETLKVYLDCKMNYSHTAKKLFVHINTVRKRIDQIHDKIQLDLDDPLSRLKLEVLLKLVE